MFFFMGVQLLSDPGTIIVYKCFFFNFSIGLPKFCCFYDFNHTDKRTGAEHFDFNLTGHLSALCYIYTDQLISWSYSNVGFQLARCNNHCISWESCFNKRQKHPSSLLLKKSFLKKTKSSNLKIMLNNSSTKKTKISRN